MDRAGVRTGPFPLTAPDLRSSGPVPVRTRVHPDRRRVPDPEAGPVQGRPYRTTQTMLPLLLLIWAASEMTWSIIP